MNGVLLVTANVGSIFEDERLMKEWIFEFSQNVTKCEPRFLALHCQEVGGKHEKRVTTDRFFRALLHSLPQFASGRVFVDDDSEAFTALGSVYLSRDNDVSIWHFGQQVFVALSDWLVLNANNQWVEKRKFPPSLCAEATKARKGLMRTRWRFNHLTLDLVNLHLFHDACNLHALSEFPSKFARIRRAALEWTLLCVEDKQIPLFLFGDFNFRLDSRAFVANFTSRDPVISRDDQILFKDAEEELVLCVERKRFEFRDKELFATKWQSLRSLDKELQPFSERIFELPICFPPSYPFGEDLISGAHYMSTRCPSWCDRILFNRSAQSVLRDAHYSLWGASHAMGDHKPIGLSARLSLNAYVMTTKGIYRETSV